MTSHWYWFLFVSSLKQVSKTMPIYGKRPECADCMHNFAISQRSIDFFSSILRSYIVVMICYDKHNSFCLTLYDRWLYRKSLWIVILPKVTFELKLIFSMHKWESESGVFSFQFSVLTASHQPTCPLAPQPGLCLKSPLTFLLLEYIHISSIC